MLKCRDITRILTEEQPQGFWRRLELKMHLLMCVHCRRYAGQIRRIGRGAREWGLSTNPDPTQTARMEKDIHGRICGHDHPSD